MPGPADGRTWYVVMGVDPGAPQDEVRAAYLRLARSLHPDRHEAGSVTERQLAERRMREVNAAWAVLGDPSSRADYDRELRPRAASSRPSPTGPRPSSSRPPTPGRRPASELFDHEPEGPFTTRRPEFLRGTRERGGKPTYVVADDDELVELTKHESFLLRRVPVLIALAIAVGIFIGSAYAGSHSSSSPSNGSLRIPTTVSCDIVKPGSGGC